MNTQATGGHTSKSSKILKCQCLHAYQDAKYGKGMRVCNPAKEGKYRCTVCRAVHSP